MPTVVSRAVSHTHTRPASAQASPAEREREGAADAQPALEEEETPIQGSRKARREMQHSIYICLKHLDATLPSYL
jgi:hypothetical protein